MKKLISLIVLIGLMSPSIHAATTNEPPTISMSVNRYEGNETDKVIHVIIVRNGDLSETSTVFFELAPQTATLNEDFTLPANVRRVIFRPGESQQIVSVPLIDDDQVEPEELFHFRLTDTINGTLLHPSSSLMVIKDNDIPAVFEFVKEADEVVEDNNTRLLDIRRSGNLKNRGAIHVTVDPTRTTAIEGRDYTLPSTTLNYNPGDTALVMPVQLIDNDQLDKNPRRIGLRITSDDLNSQAGTQNQLLLLIYDDERTPVFRFTKTTDRVRENAQFIDVVIEQLNALNPSTVFLEVDPASTASGTTDFSFSSQTLQFSNRETSRTIRIPILNDATQEPNETIVLNLKDPSDDAEVGSPRQLVITLEDNDDPNNPQDTILIKQPAQHTPVVNNQSELSVIAETTLTGGLTYQWNVIEGSPNDVIIESPNSPTSKISFIKTGTYLVRVLIRNRPSNIAIASELYIQNPVIAQSIHIDPIPQRIFVGDTPIFRAVIIDQFGNPTRDAPVFWNTSRLATAKFLGDELQTFGPDTIRITARTINNKEDSMELTIHPARSNLTINDAHAYPNPWKPGMALNVIRFTQLAAQTHITIYTSYGRKVYEMTSIAGEEKDWPLTNSDGESVASGVYIYRMEQQGNTKSGKLFVVK